MSSGIELNGTKQYTLGINVVEKISNRLNDFSKSLNGSTILIIGIAYKKDIDEMRESPSLKLIEIYREKGAVVEYHDPLVPVLSKTRKYNYDMKSVKLTKEKIKS